MDKNPIAYLKVIMKPGIFQCSVANILIPKALCLQKTDTTEWGEKINLHKKHKREKNTEMRPEQNETQKGIN